MRLPWVRTLFAKPAEAARGAHLRRIDIRHRQRPTLEEHRDFVRVDAVVLRLGAVNPALAWNASHARSAVEWALLLLAVPAPALATWLVWRARAHRSRLDEAQAIN